LESHGLPPNLRDALTKGVVNAVKGALFWNGLTFLSKGAGRPADAAGQMLSSEIYGLFKSYGVAGNSLNADKDLYKIGVITEVEAAAQTTRKQLSGIGDGTGVMARPARISEARKSIGDIERIVHPGGKWTPLGKLIPGGLDTEGEKYTGPLFPLEELSELP
jgi:hypothetical protein